MDYETLLKIFEKDFVQKKCTREKYEFQFQKCQSAFGKATTADFNAEKPTTN